MTTKEEIETGIMKVKDLFVTDQLLTGRTQIDTVPKGRNVISISANGFIPSQPDVDDVAYGTDGTGQMFISGGSVQAVANVTIPDGATITEVAVYGNAATEDSTWTLYRNPTTTNTAETLATATVNTADSSISLAVVDNSAFSYHIAVGTLVTNDRLFGAKIKYKFE